MPMTNKNSTKDLNNQRIVFEVDTDTKVDLTKIAKSKGLTVAMALRKITADYIRKNKKGSSN